jgi:hypothetical protein
MRNNLIALALIAFVSLPAFAGDTQLEIILVTVKKLNGKSKSPRLGRWTT